MSVWSVRFAWLGSGAAISRQSKYDNTPCSHKLNSSNRIVTNSGTKSVPTHHVPIVVEVLTLQVYKILSHPFNLNN